MSGEFEIETLENLPTDVNAFPVSFAQERLWYLHQLEPESPAYNVSMAFRLNGLLNVAALEQSLNSLAQRHEILRTTFSVHDHEPVQVVHPPSPLSLSITDLRPLQEPEQEETLRRLLLEDARRPFELDRGPLIRFGLIQTEDDEHVFHLNMHHIVSDEWSARILFQELSSMYWAYSNNANPSLAELPMQYADYSVWQRDWLQGENLETQLSYWRKHLADVTTVNLPIDRPRPAVQTYCGGKQFITISPKICDQLKSLSRQEGVTVFMTLLAAFQIFLHRYTGQDDVPVGTPIAGRTRPETDGLIGFFVNTLVIRADLTGNPTAREFLARVCRGALDAYDHQDLPFERLIQELNPERDLSRNPLFQVMFAFHGSSESSLELPNIQARRVSAASEIAKFDLSATVTEASDSFRVSFSYNSDIFNADTIERMLGHFQTLLEGIVANPEQRIDELPLLTEAEKHQLLVEWNDSDGEYPKHQCIHELFEAQVENTPDAIAMVFEDRQLTYRELNNCANQLAHYLQKLGVGASVPVGICLERSIEMVVGLLGILKAGGAYVPLDPAYPKERLAFMLDDSRASVLLTQERMPKETNLGIEDLTRQMPGNRARIKIVYVDSDRIAIGRENQENFKIATAADDLAYVIYTSGSTGRPKGVMVSHRALVAHTLSATKHFEIGSNDKVLQFASISFDVAAEEMFPAWLCGASVVLLSERTPAIAEFVNYLTKDGITVANLPSAYWHQWVDELDRLANPLPSPLRLLIVGNEKVSLDRLKRWHGHVGSKVRWLNAYGPTEAIVTATLYEAPEREDAYADLTSVPIGRPLTNRQIYVLDRSLQPVPIGVTGELYIGGPALALGYLNNPELTAEKFIESPFFADATTRLYRTGDLARYLPDGNLEFLGRIDAQVKIRGYRIELGEIETVLAHHTGVRAAVVVAREDSPGDKRLVAYAVASPGSTPSASDLRSYLQQQLPEYMVPSAFMFLESLPLTAGGKLDRNALPAPDQTRSELKVDFTAPRTAVEERLASIWSEVLKIDKVGIDDNFFHLGGHSLLATQVISRINDSFAANIRLRRLFETPTIAGLAAAIDANLGIENEPQRILPIVPKARHHDAPLSLAQQRLWFLDRLDPDSAAYNVPAAFRLVGELDARALEQSLNEIVRRHEVLRTVIATVNGDPVQKLLPPSSVALPCSDISDRPDKDRHQVLPSLLREEAEKPFDLSRGPLLRSKLLRLAPQDQVLFLNMHHIVSDGWSMGVLFREISELYEAYCSGKASPLPELPIQYADYAVWQREWLTGENVETQLSYWRKQLDGLLTLQLPTDRAHPAVRSYRGSIQALNLSARLSQAIKTLSQREGGTLFMTLLAVFQLLLSRYSGQSDIAVGSPIAGRNRQETEGLIGFFINTLVLRADLSNQPTFRELLRQVRETTLEAYSHQDLPFERLVEELQPQRNLNQNPLFQVTFQLDDSSSQLLTLPAIDAEEMEMEVGVSQFDLSLFMIDNGKNLKGRLQYNTDIFNAETIERMLGHFQTLLEGIVGNPEQRIDQLPLLTEAEKSQLLVEWNETKRDYPSDKCIHQLFEEQVERTPEAVAVVFEGQQLSYRELNDRANQLAHHLRELGAKPNTLVALCLGRSIELVVAIYGVLKAGGAYLPVDPGYPQERLESMLQGVQASIVITQGEAELSGSAQVHVVDLVSSRSEIEKQSKANPSQLSQPSDLIYVIFTSGSTGRPKGAAVYHQSFTNLVEWYTTSFDITEKDKALVISSPSFDLTQKNIFGPLIRGGELHLVAGAEYDPGAINRIIAEQKITLINCTPSAFYPLVEQAELRGYEELTSLREVFLGGEAILLARLRHWLESEACHSEIVNTYGPTECTDVCAYYRLDRHNMDAYTFVPLGRPINNVGLVALDEHSHLCPIGMIGELCIAGDGMGAGYVNDAELTGQKFVANPFKELSGETLYKTGDLVRYLRDGNFEYLGRRDHQVKIRGHRIELGEIEAVLGQHPAVREAVVLAREDNPGDRRLVAYAAASPGMSESASELRSYLQQKLPEYMVPTTFMFLESLPLTPNGKLDRKALPAPDPTRPELNEGFTAPRTATEDVLAGIWAEVLKVDKVGIRDNFFDLGGHSLLAVRLTNTIQKQFKTPIRVAHVFAAPTVEQFARLLQGPGEPSWLSLVALNSQGSRRPFFWVHGEASDAYLPRYLGPDQPLYGLRHQSEDGRPALYRTVEEIAAHYLEEIRSVQPEGPYLLGGYCFGALVALEMAQRLQAHRQAIDLLVLMDPPSGQTPNWQDRSQQAATRSLLDDLRRHLHAIATLRTQAKWRYVLERAIAKVRETMLNAFNPVKKITQKVIWETHVLLGLPIPLSMRSPYILGIYRKATQGYAPRPYQGNLVIFCDDEYPEQSRLKWSDPNKALTQVYKVPGDHTSVLQEPNVGYWAKTLKSCLDVVQ